MPKASAENLGAGELGPELSSTKEALAHACRLSFPAAMCRVVLIFSAIKSSSIGIS